MPELAAKIGNLPWVEDGIEGVREFRAVNGLVSLAATGLADSLIEQPWVIEGRNYPALEALSILALNSPDELARIMSHPTVRDGITDQEAKIIGTLLFYIVDPDFLALFDLALPDKLLYPEQVTLEERTIELPLAGETELTIIRIRPGVEHTMDSLEHSVRSIEEFMGFPFPRQQVIYLFMEAPRYSSYHGTHVEIRIDEQATRKDVMFQTVAHEASHYYWNSFPIWILEGAATFMQSVANNTLQGPSILPPCPLARNISEFDILDIDLASFDYYNCPYALGERLFRDLYQNMDDTTFRQAFRHLHLYSHTVFNIPSECEDYYLAICHVREAFSTYVPVDKAATIKKVIDRWYDGSEPYDLSSIDDSPVEADIAAIEGRIEKAYLSLTEGGTPVSIVTLEPDQISTIYLNLDYSYEDSDGPDSLPIEIAVSFEDGFEFHRTRTELQIPVDGTRNTRHIWIPHQGEALGRYRVQAYWGEQKIAEATYEIVPARDP